MEIVTNEPHEGIIEGEKTGQVFKSQYTHKVIHLQRYVTPHRLGYNFSKLEREVKTICHSTSIPSAIHSFHTIYHLLISVVTAICSHFSVRFHNTSEL